jgi:prolyl 4-hydroxylase
MASDLRNNRRAILDDREWANLLFDRVKENVPHSINNSSIRMKLVGLNERFRGYEYQVGQCFVPHSDESFSRNLIERSYYTFLIYLNEGFEGGETALFLERQKMVEPRTGMGLIFEHQIVHAGCEVTMGKKYVLRTDLMYRQALIRLKLANSKNFPFRNKR